MRKRTNFKTMKLSPNTLSILEAIDEFGFRTLAELRQSVLAKYSRRHCWRRLKRLTDAKLIRPVLNADGTFIGWASLKSSQVILNEQGEVSKIERGKVPKYCSSFHHDLASREILDHFKKLSIIKNVIPDSKLKIEAFAGMRGQSRREMNRILSLIPDARLAIKSQGHLYQVAFELELTQKTHDRIQTKLEHYIAKSGYDFVIYVCKDERIYDLIWRNYHWVLSHSPAVKFANQKANIYLCLLSELKNDFLGTKLKSHSDEFSLNDIEP